MGEILSLGIPIISFIHKDIGELESKKVESDPAKRQALEEFIMLTKQIFKKKLHHKC